MISENKVFSRYDVVIIGAGPAGCTAAKYLLKKYKVLLIDRSKIPKDKPCGGLLIDKTQDFIGDWNIPKNIFSQPKNINIKAIDWDNNLEINFKKKIWNVSRKKFDSWLLKEAREGIDFSSETKFLNFEKKGDDINLIIEKNNKSQVIKTKYLIAANGALSNIRKNLTKKDVKYYIAMQYWMKCENLIDVTYFIYDNDITDFYSWVIPKKNTLIIGSALKPDKEVKRKMDILISKLKNKLNINGDIFKQESAILSRPETKQSIFLGKNNIFFIGEAAGFISSSSGEGISFALRSGYNCARAINENFKNPILLYKKLSKNLIMEIEEKINKAKIFSSLKKRRAYFIENKKNNENQNVS